MNVAFRSSLYGGGGLRGPRAFTGQIGGQCRHHDSKSRPPCHSAITPVSKDTDQKRAHGASKRRRQRVPWRAT